MLSFLLLPPPLTHTPHAERPEERASVPLSAFDFSSFCGLLLPLLLPLFVPVFVLLIPRPPTASLRHPPGLMCPPLPLPSSTLVYCFTAAVFGQSLGFSTSRTTADQLSSSTQHPLICFLLSFNLFVAFFLMIAYAVLPSLFPTPLMTPSRDRCLLFGGGQVSPADARSKKLIEHRPCSENAQRATGDFRGYKRITRRKEMYVLLHT